MNLPGSGPYRAPRVGRVGEEKEALQAFLSASTLLVLLAVCPPGTLRSVSPTATSKQ